MPDVPTRANGVCPHPLNSPRTSTPIVAGLKFPKSICTLISTEKVTSRVCPTAALANTNIPTKHPPNIFFMFRSLP